MTFDHAILEEAAEYPGHPVTLAYLIVQIYSSLSTAQAMGKNYLVVEEDKRLPGAGGHNTAAVCLLTDLDRGKSWEEVVTGADERWARCDDQRDGGKYRERWQKGQAQADRMKPLLREAVAEWLGCS